MVPVTWGPIQTPSLALRLRTFGFPAAPRIILLASPRAQTPCPVVQNGRHNSDHLASCMALARLSFGQNHILRAMPNYCRLVSGSFRLPCGILFIFLSRYYCAISLETCLGLGVDASRIPTQYPMRGTLERPNPFCLAPTGLSPSMASRPSELRLRQNGLCGSPKHHIPPKGFGLPYTLFTRRYSGHRYCFLFLPLLRCFTSGGSPSSRSANLSKEDSRELSFGDPRFEGCLRLAGAYRSLPRPSSTLELSHPLDGVLPKASTN